LASIGYISASRLKQLVDRMHDDFLLEGYLGSRAH
jgi:hypothetical protein